jgi:flavin-dependent dehydrogenase
MEVRTHFDVIVVGAGPAGSASAIAAAGRGLRVLLLEATRFPRHKVCGEFVSAESAEVLRYLLRDGADHLLAAPRITTARLHSEGRSVEIAVEPAAYSIPRFRLDEVLWLAAEGRGISCRNENVTGLSRSRDEFVVRTTSAEYRAKSVINASGRWSKLSRRVVKGSAWVGLKAHFEGETDDVVDLYFLNGGYCGVQAVSPGVLNACALVKQGTAKSLDEVFQMDAVLAGRARKWTAVTELFATAPVYLGAGAPVCDGMLQVGDAAGFVDPFVGDGISLALRSGVLAGRSVGAISAERYAELYRASFAQIFRSTSRVRALLSVARPLRPALINAFRLPAIGRHIFNSTRHTRFDVIEAPIG